MAGTFLGGSPRSLSFTLAALALLAAAPAGAQKPPPGGGGAVAGGGSKVGNYKVTAFQAEYEPLSESARFLGTMSPNLELWDYSQFSNISIPADFNFRYFGQQVKTIYATGGGAIGIGNGTNIYDSSPLPNGAAPNGTLAPFWDYWGGSSWDDYKPGVRWEIAGEGDEQILKVEYKDVYLYYCYEYENQYGWGDPQPECESAKHFTFAVWIHEASGGRDSLIQYRYAPITNPGGDDTPYPWGYSPSITVGIESPDNATGLMNFVCGSNCKLTDFPENTVIQFGQGADLVAEVAGEPVGRAGVPMRVAAKVSNVGAQDASGFGARLHLSEDATLDPSDPVIASLPADVGDPSPDPSGLFTAGSEQQVTLDFGSPKLPRDLEEGGAYYLIVDADPVSPAHPRGLVAEDVEQNNTGVYGPFTVGARKPDLAVGDLATDTLTVAPGGNLLVEWNVTNLGNLPADGVPYWVVLSVEDVITPSDTVIGQDFLQVDELTTMPVSKEIKVPPTTRPGVYHLGVVIDPENQLDEIDDFNNVGILGDLVLVGSDTVSIVSATLPQAYVGAPYCAHVEAAGGNGTYVWSAKKPADLPPGLALREEPADARAKGKPFDTLLCGVPSLRGDYRFELTVTSAGKTVSKNLQLSVGGEVPPLSIVTQELPSGTFQVGYEASLYATGGRPPYRWELAGTTPLPRGVDLTEDGRIQGMPGIDGRFPFTVRVSDSAGAQATAELYVSITPPGRLTCVSQTLPAARVADDYAAQLIAAGGSKPYLWSTVETRRLAQGVADPGETTPAEPPPGLVLAESGSVSGTPSSAGSYLWTAKVLDQDHSEDVCILLVDFSAGALNVTTAAVPVICTGRDYSVQLEANGGDGGFLTWSLDENSSLPEGLELTPDGLLSGNVSAEVLEGNPSRTFNVAVHVRDGSNARGVGPVALRVDECAGGTAAPERTKTVKTGCSAGGSSLALLGFAALALLGLRRRR